MPLDSCPWMSARCPHYKAKCKDPESKHCFYVKNSTSAAQITLRQLKAIAGQQKSVDPDLKKQIDDLEGFLGSGDA